MLDKYLRAGVTKPRMLKLLHIIGELKSVQFKSLKTVKNPVVDKVATKKLLTEFWTDGLLSQVEIDSYCLTVNSLELLKKAGLLVTHLIKNPEITNSAHTVALREFLLPFLFLDNHHAVVYPRFEEHQLRPDACLITTHDKGYQIRFIEVENTDKDPQYLLEKYEKYARLGSDAEIYQGWWKPWAKKIKLPYCSKDEFKFSVLCKGNKTFDKEGWEWA